MVTSTGLKDILYRHCNQIDELHVDLFLSFINELRICNSSKIGNPFLFINNIMRIILKKFIQNLLTFPDVKHFIKNI